MNLSSLLLILPLLTIVFGYTVYKFQGKRQLVSMDAVQFLYTFFVAPMIFVWFKLMLFVLLRTELGESISIHQFLFFDTIFSVFFLFIYAFISMHSLTKSFRLRKDDDPLYDLFAHSEYIHLWLSHHAMIILGFALFSLFTLVNLFLPMPLSWSQGQFYFLIFLGFILGPILYVGLLMADPRQKRKHFLRYAKLVIAGFAIWQMLLYAIFNPAFSSAFLIYWLVTTTMISLVICASLSFKSRRASSFFERLADFFRHYRWGINIELFEKKKVE